MSDRRKLELSGVVDTYGGGEWSATDVRIGETNVVGALVETFGDARPNVRVWLGAEAVANGPLWATTGFGGTDVTPAEAPEIEVGDIDLVDRLADLDEREVVLIVEDA